jgi:uncharacterized protein YecE (DUF72 family)
VADAAWQRFAAALRAAGKLGAILLQFPPWFPNSKARKDYIVACAQRAWFGYRHAEVVLAWADITAPEGWTAGAGPQPWPAP